MSINESRLRKIGVYVLATQDDTIEAMHRQTGASKSEIVRRLLNIGLGYTKPAAPSEV